MDYRRASGQIRFELFDGETEGFMRRNAGSSAAAQATEKTIEFVHKEVE
jgi:hypothetical protein